jgi:importin subunit beta-1
LLIAVLGGSCSRLFLVAPVLTAAWRAVRAEFVKANFETENERNYIMQTVCEGTQAEKKELKVAAYECLVQIAELYYDKLPQYMPSLYQLTLTAIQKATTDQEVTTSTARPPLTVGATACPARPSLYCRHHRSAAATHGNYGSLTDSHNCASSQEDDVGQQAVEFWTTVCDEEIEINEDAEEARLANRQPERQSHRFVVQGLQHLVPLLLEAMCKQEEDAEDDVWNMAMAASTSLAKVAQACGDDVVGHVRAPPGSASGTVLLVAVLSDGHVLDGLRSRAVCVRDMRVQVMPFIDKHISSGDWRRREASALAFGSILEGPSPNSLSPFMSPAIEAMIRMMADPSVQVKDTSAWTIGRICEHRTLPLLHHRSRRLVRVATRLLASTLRRVFDCRHRRRCASGGPRSPSEFLWRPC